MGTLPITVAEVTSEDRHRVIDPLGWASAHPIGAGIIIAIWLSISLTMITHMWITKREASTFKKIRWTFLILVPLAGWTAYPACFNRLSHMETPCEIGFGS